MKKLSRFYPSLKSLSSYINNLIKRVRFFQEWLDMEPSDTTLLPVNELCQNAALPGPVLQQLRGFIPTRFWLGAFYFPHGFFTGILQHHARVYTLSIDQLQFDTGVLTPA